MVTTSSDYMVGVSLQRMNVCLLKGNMTPYVCVCQSYTASATLCVQLNEHNHCTV